MMNERLSTIMTKNILTVSPDDTLDVVKKILFENRIHHIPVVEGKKLVGIVTSWDLIKTNRKFEEYHQLQVKGIMTVQVASLGPNELIGAAAMVFMKHLFHGLPIVDEKGDLVGIVTTHDILRYEFRKEYPDDVFINETHWMEG